MIFLRERLFRFELAEYRPLGDPTRFLDPRNEDKKNPMAWIPFGAGRHRCMGIVFAQLQLRAIWSHLLRNFDFELTDTHAMVAGTQLGDFESLLVTARVSPTGRAADAASIFETWSQPVLPGDNTFIDLVIADKAVPKENNNE